MEVILLERVGRMGTVGDVVKVKNGYARNFLIPHGKALRATADNKEIFAAKRAEIEKENAAKRQAAEALAAKMEGLSLTLIRQASEDGRLFGSVNSRDIANAIKEQGFEATHSMVTINVPIKAVGTYTVLLTLHPEVVIEVAVNVSRTEQQ